MPAMTRIPGPVKAAAALLTLISVPMMAAADQNNTVFVGAGFSHINNKNLVELTTDKSSIGISSAELVVGYQFNPLLGLDIRYGAGLNDRSVSALPDNLVTDEFEYAIDGYQSIYYRPEITNSEAKLYVLIGYTSLDLTIDSINANGDTTATEKLSQSGTSYGLGMGWFADDDVNINLEYRALLDDEQDEFTVITLSFDYRFHF